MTTRRLLAALGLVWLAALAGVVWMMTLAGMRPHHALWLLVDTDIVLKACAALSVASAAFAIVSARTGARPRARTGVAGALAWGVLGALYGAANARSMLIDINPPIPFAVYAPNYAAALLVLLIGLTGAIPGLLSLRRPR